ncbi:MAG: SDR family NAD(P)-dependent oxidoreductase [Lawsonibacter sp.]
MGYEQVTIVFGATGSVGAGVCRSLAQSGHVVVVHYFQNRAKAEQLTKEIVDAGGVAMAAQADVRDFGQVQALVDKVVAACGAIHAAVNFVHRDDYQPTEVMEMQWRDWDCHLDAVKSHFHICKALLPVMKAQQYGRIIYISGGLAYRFYKGCAAYSAAKAGMNAFSKSLASEVGKDHITVNIVAPGKVVQTDCAGADRFQEDAVSSCPLGRFTTPSDLAGVILFFTSPAAANITGQTIYVSGGEIMPMP